MRGLAKSYNIILYYV